ncbi:MAG: VOC family protein [Candidatus Bathyarchaeia archaeon]
MDHTIVHFEIPANDVQKLKTFYSSLFGWKIEKMPGPTEYYSILTVPVDAKGMPQRPGVNGGMMKKQMPGQTALNYISVESIDEYAKKVVKLGGQVLHPKTEIPGIGWWALAADPDGNQFGMLQSV